MTTHPDDSPAGLKQQAQTYGFTFPYLYDETQDVAHALQAACTPDLFLFDKDFKLVYRGQFDESRPGNGVPVTGEDLRAAIDAVLAGKPVPRISGLHRLQYQVEGLGVAGLVAINGGRVQQVASQLVSELGSLAGTELARIAGYQAR